MFDPIWPWIENAFNTISAGITAALAWLAAIVDSLNPFHFVPQLAAWVADYLPEPSPTVDLLATQIVAFSQWFLPYISILDYFVNLPIVLACVAVVVAVESGLFFFRAWRMVRSLAT